jgi:hypothetical protein
LRVKIGGILPYFEDLKRGANKEFGPKDFFEIASNSVSALFLAHHRREPLLDLPG